MKTLNTRSGFVRWIILIVIAIIVLSYLGFDLRTIVEDDLTQDNIGYVWGFVLLVWEDYLRDPVLWTWNNIVLFIFNDLFLDNLDKLRDGSLFDEIRDTTPRVTR